MNSHLRWRPYTRTENALNGSTKRFFQNARGNSLSPRYLKMPGTAQQGIKASKPERRSERILARVGEKPVKCGCADSLNGCAPVLALLCHFEYRLHSITKNAFTLYKLDWAYDCQPPPSALYKSTMALICFCFVSMSSFLASKASL
jgi:hypothetical protein